MIIINAIEQLIEDIKQMDEVNQAKVIDYVKKLKEHHFETLEKQANCIFDEYDEAFKELAK